MKVRSVLLALALGMVPLAAAPVASAKDKPKPAPLPEAKAGFSKIDCPPTYVYLSVPADYDAKKFYPLLLVVHSIDPGTPEDFVGAWAETPLSKTWILASLKCTDYNTDITSPQLKLAMTKVRAVYKIDEKRMVLAGHNAGAQMAWHFWLSDPAQFAGIVAMSAGIGDPDRGNSGFKKLEGRPCYLFRGAKDTASYTAAQFDADKKYLDAMKLVVTVEVKPDFQYALAKDSLPKIALWVDGIWPPGTYRDKALDVEHALELKDLPRAQTAIDALRLDLKKNPYPAFEPRVLALQAQFLEIGRAQIDAAKRMVEGGQPLLAVEAMEAAAKALKGLKILETEASAALTALKKDPVVAEALRKKEAEASASSYMEKAAAAEAKGDLAKALDWYRKAAALGETSKKAEAEAKIKELEPKVPAK